MGFFGFDEKEVGAYMFNIDAEKIITELGYGYLDHFVDHVSRNAYFKAKDLKDGMNEIFGNIKNVYIAVPFSDLRFTDVLSILSYTHAPYNHKYCIIYPLLLEFDNGNMVLIDSRYPVIIKPLRLDQEI